MTKRKLQTIINHYHDGISVEICIAILIDLLVLESSVTKAMWINRFYESVFDLSVKQK